MYDFGLRQALTGYKITYREGEVNHCPGCGRSHWIMGRVSAECSVCGTALPYKNGSSSGSGTITKRGAKLEFVTATA